MKKNGMINKEYEDEISLDLAELLLVIWQKMYLVILVGIICAGIAYMGTKILITPLYTSTTKMYVLSKQDESTAITYSELQTGTQLTKDYMELVKSRPVLEKVIDKLNLEMSAEELKRTITVDTPEDTRILVVSVENEDPELAKTIADEIREAVSIQIKSIMAVESVNTVEEANLPEKKSSPNTLKNTMLGGIIGCILVVGIITLLYVLDDTIKTPDDVEKYLGLNVLTSIPIYNRKKQGKSVSRKGRR